MIYKKNSPIIKRMLVVVTFLSMVLVSSTAFSQTDYFGVQIPQGSAIDLGAVEFVSGPGIVDPVISNPVQNFGVTMNNYTAFQVSGTATPSSIVEIYSNNTLIGSTSAASNGSWTATVDFSPVNEGALNMYVKSSGKTSTTLSGVLTKTYPVNAPREVTVEGGTN